MGRTVATDTVSISISTNNQTISGIPWFEGMNVQQAMEAAYDIPPGIGFAIQFYGSALGYLILMVDGTFDADPYYWFLYVNGVETPTGIDQTILNSGDAVELNYQQYDPQVHTAPIYKQRRELALKARK